MTTSTLTKGLRGLMLGLVVALAPLGAAPCGLAHADVNAEVQYVKEVADAGIPGEPNQLLTNGNVMCNAVNTGEGILDFATRVAPRAGLTAAQAGFEAGAAVRWLCPNQKWQIQELRDADQSIPAVTAAIAGYGS
jgi:hypothetical protein